jgi:hypothetical protein
VGCFLLLKEDLVKRYIVDATETQVATGRTGKVIVQVNAALTGTIKVIDGTTGNTANVATITNPTVGSVYEYWDFTSGVRIVASGACDITVCADQSRGMAK